MTRFDAVVIGAGPAGSAAALLLARQGRGVALVEKARFPRRKVCGEFLSATNVALLDRFGVGADWRAQAGPEVRRVALFCGATQVAAPMPPAGRGGYGRALGRDRLDLLLRDAAQAAGATLFQPWQAVSVEGDARRQVGLSDGHGGAAVLSAPLVIAAHGSWEPGPLPSHLPRASHEPGDLLGFKAHFRGGALASDLMPLLVFPGGYGGMVGADEGRLSVSLCIRRDALATVRRPGTGAGEAVERHLRAHCAGLRAALGGAGVEGGWLAAGPIRPGMRSGFADDIFRVGNTAGESHPIIAEGISIALQSAWLLADALRDADIDDPAARRRAGTAYATAWRRQFALRIRAASALAALCALPGTLPLVAGAARMLPGLLTLGAGLSGKTRPIPGLKVPAGETAPSVLS